MNVAVRSVRSQTATPPAAPPPPGPGRLSDAARAATRAVRTGHLSDPTGEVAVAALEAAVAAWLEVDPARVRATASGTGALALALLTATYGLPRRARVIASALLPPYVTGAAAALGLRLALADAGWPTCTPDFEAWTRALAATPSGVPTVLLTGTGTGVAHSVEDALRVAALRGALVVEDAAASLGARGPDGKPAGTGAHMGVFSMAWGKSLSVGEGGLLVVASRPLQHALERVCPRPLPSQSDRHRTGLHNAIVPGALAGRLTVPAAELARALLPHLPDRLALRRRVAARAAAVARAVAAQRGLEVRACDGPDSAGTTLCAVRFPTAEAAAAADRRASRVHLDFAPPAATLPANRAALPLARDSVQRVRLLTWWDSAVANQDRVERLLDAFAYVLDG